MAETIAKKKKRASGSLAPRPEEKRASEILALLEKEYSRAWCTLDYKDPFQLLVSTILSAQCTDARVNLITPALFLRFPDARAMAQADVRELEALIRPSGFYHSKAKNILASSRILVQKHGGKVPSDMASLLELPGVARKTANIVLFHAFGQVEGIAVDTHCMRVSHRLGFTSSREQQNKIEKELMALIPREDWGMYTNYMVSHGRKYCMARKPDCENCPLRRLCPKKGVE
ncbi:MAG: endonuclease III [Candidatus Micrarchaeota archaeon]